MAVNGNQDTVVQGNQTTKIAGNTEHTTEGKAYLGADGGMAVEATSGDLQLASNDNTNIRAGGTIDAEATSTTTIKGSTIELNP